MRSLPKDNGTDVNAAHGRTPSEPTSPYFEGGLIIYGAAPTVACVIRNMSKSGALLLVTPIGIPDEFTLVVKPEMRKQPCRVIWRSADQMGVNFI